MISLVKTNNYRAVRFRPASSSYLQRTSAAVFSSPALLSSFFFFFSRATSPGCTPAAPPIIQDLVRNVHVELFQRLLPHRWASPPSHFHLLDHPKRDALFNHWTPTNHFCLYRDSHERNLALAVAPVYVAHLRHCARRNNHLRPLFRQQRQRLQLTPLAFLCSASILRYEVPAVDHALFSGSE